MIQQHLRRLAGAATMAATALLVATPASDLAAQSVPDPEAHFGFSMGTAEQLARWEEILDYFTLLGDASDRMVVDTLGRTTLGNPFVVVTLSSPTNLVRLDQIRASSKTLAEGRVGAAEAERLARSIPATAVLHHNIHSTEIGASQTSVELVYRLATADDADTRQILDEVVTVLIPSGNPDGQIMVTDWYRRNVGTDFEDARMPYLYHPYAGHDNNRDFFQAQLVETRYWMELMFHTAYPQVYLDQHQMGSTGPRMFVPPFPDPMDPDIHPLQWQSMQLLGGAMVADLQRAGKKGVITEQMYRIWGQEGALTGRHHNIVALLTETASANIASSVEVTRDELEQAAGRLGPGATYGFTMNFVDPWWGGTWALQDIVDYQMIAAMSFLRNTARYHEDYLLGRWQMAAETMDRARAEGPYAWVIPVDQADPVTAAEMVDALALQGVEVHRAETTFTATPMPVGMRPQSGDPERIAQWRAGPHGAMEAAEDTTDGDEDGQEDAQDEQDDHAMHDDPDHAAMRAMHHPEARTFPAGSWVVMAAQPAWAAVEDLLMPQERELLYEYPGGPFLRSYDGAGYTMPLQMGVDAVIVGQAFDAELSPVAPGTARPAAALPTASRWLGLSTSVNQAYHVANRLAADGIPVSRNDDWFLVPAGNPTAVAALETLVEATGVPVVADPESGGAVPVERARVGLYQGWASSMDEGWTRLILERYGFDMTVLMNEDVRDGDLSARFDVVVIPSEISLDRLIEGADEDDAPGGFRGGIGEDGVENLKRFVRNGGTLVTLDRGDQVVLEHFDLPVRDALDGLGRDELFTPASLYRIELEAASPLTRGSPDQVAGKWAGGRAYEPTDFGGGTAAVTAVGRWAEDPDDLLMSGLVVGAEHIAGKAAILDVTYGQGRIVMYGFRVQHRAQTHGTFKLLFNALMRSAPRTATQ
ncbi:MAG: M14 family zinc carboxypeptidase [Longimicrobiales bacterium]